MVSALLIGLVVGFVISIPPGPISVAVIKQALLGNFRAGNQIGIAAALMDMLYVLLAAFASSAVVTSLQDFVVGNVWLEFSFQVICIVVLVILGRKYFQATEENFTESEQKEEKQEAKAKKLGASTPFALGILLAVTNIANPSFLPSLIGVAGYLQANGWVAGHADNVLYAVGFGTGAGLWFLFLLRALSRLRHRVPTGFFLYIFKFAGGAFFLFAAILLARIVFSTDWGRLL